jgi:protein involved in polysaccharide export with SLBB domain
MNFMRQACFVLLALAGLAAAAQTPPASKASKAGQPVFMDFGTLTETAPTSNAVPATVSDKGPDSGKPKAKDGGQGSVFSPQQTGTSAGTNATTAFPGTNTAALISLTGYVPDDKYKLRVGDKISLQILEDRDAPKGLVVADSGELDVPYVGRVAAADKTCKQLADELKTRLEKEYYYRATVIIALDVANKLLGRIYVWGQVRNQGPIDVTVNENLTAGKAILRAGGFGDFANKKRVKVVRGGAVEGAAKQSFELNMVDILEKGKTEKDVILQPDDFIIVPSRLINF